MPAVMNLDADHVQGLCDALAELVAGRPESWHALLHQPAYQPLSACIEAAREAAQQASYASAPQKSGRPQAWQEVLLSETPTRQRLNHALRHFDLTFRTPLHGVLGIAQLLQNTPSSELQKGYLQHLQEAAYQLLQAVEQLEALIFATKRINTSTPTTPTHDELAQAQDRFAGYRVVVAEDQPLNRIVIDGMLRHAGIVVQLCNDGQELLDVLSNSALPPADLILLDIHMPVLDGLQTTRLLRAQACQLPIIALTAGLAEREQQACLAAGMDAVLGKPLEMKQLLACLQAWLPGQQRAGPSGPFVHAVQAHDDFQNGLPDLPGLDMQQALARFLGRHDLLCQARDAFLLQHAQASSLLQEQFALQDWAGMRRTAHAIKGAAGNLGALQLLEIAQHIEASPHTSQSAGLLDMMREAMQILHD